MLLPLSLSMMMVRRCVRSERTTGFFGTERRDYWHWIETLPKNNAIHYALTHARSVLEAKTPQGRGRAFVRFALREKSLADSVQLLVSDSALRECVVASSRWGPSLHVPRADPGKGAAASFTGLGRFCATSTVRRQWWRCCLRWPASTFSW
jgi:hypothetical protein